MELCLSLRYVYLIGREEFSFFHFSIVMPNKIARRLKTGSGLLISDHIDATKFINSVVVETIYISLVLNFVEQNWFKSVSKEMPSAT